MLKKSPFPTFAEFAGALAKALVIVAVVNITLLALNINPVRELVKVNLWGIGNEGRPRLVYPSDLPNGQLPVEAQLRAHRLNHAEKSPDEYRVILLGESGIAGWGVPDEETLSAQLTDLDITIEGRQVVAYNLAYPQPSAPRDVVVLDAALRYNPDLVLWFMTPSSVDNTRDVIGANRVFFNVNRPRLESVVGQYPDLLGPWRDRQGAVLLDDPAWWEPYSAIRSQDLLPIWLNTLFYPIIPPDIAETDIRIAQQPLPEEPRFTDEHPGFTEMPNETWAFLEAGCRLTAANDVALYIINRPMLVGSGPNSDEVYNTLYGVDLYDRYRETLAEYAAERGIPYADTWNLIPPENYTDTPLHTDGEGYGILAAEIERLLMENPPSLCE